MQIQYFKLRREIWPERDLEVIRIESHRIVISAETISFRDHGGEAVHKMEV